MSGSAHNLRWLCQRPHVRLIVTLDRLYPGLTALLGWGIRLQVSQPSIYVLKYTDLA
jgi:hypothetical protein